MRSSVPFLPGAPRAPLAGLVAILLCSAVVQAKGPVRSPFDQEVSDRRQRFLTESARPSATAVIPLLGLTDLWDEVTDRAALRDACG